MSKDNINITVDIFIQQIKKQPPHPSAWYCLRKVNAAIVSVQISTHPPHPPTPKQTHTYARARAHTHTHTHTHTHIHLNKHTPSKEHTKNEMLNMRNTMTEKEHFFQERCTTNYRICWQDFMASNSDRQSMLPVSKYQQVPVCTYVCQAQSYGDVLTQQNRP